MCGIAGLVGKRRVEPGTVGAMVRSLAHRGPDGDGIWTDPSGRVALGHRRLAVIDTSPRGRQPMTDPTGRVTVTFNGEIYNYVELAARLRAEGAVFASASDTEVLVQAYIHWGDGFLNELNGMFAFCLIDLERRRVLCARDRFAEKPFLFARGADFFAFASEYKALLGLDGVADAVDESRVLAFLREPRRGLDDGRATAFRGIEQLRGGERLTLDLDSFALDIAPYWTPRRDATVARMAEGDAVARFRELLVDSVRLRMRSDVPQGSCLSGGLDSSTIVCIARDLLGPDAPYHVFCGRFPGTPADEGVFAETVIAHAGATAHIVKPAPEDLLARLDRFVWDNELPVGSSSQFAQWRVFETAREHGITVLLDGQGADEILGGYEQYFRRYLAALDDPAHAAAERRAIRARYPMALADGAQGFKERLPDALKRPLAQAFGIGSDFLFGLAGTPRIAPGAQPDPGADPLSRALEEDTFIAHLPTLLRYGDRNSMAHSREVRLPFCDHRIAEFALSLPPSHLMGGAQTKRLLRRATEGVLPEAIRTRWNKQGFLPPQDLWFRGPLLDAVSDTIAGAAFRRRGWWNVRWWRAALGRLRAGETHLAWLLWKPFIAEAWMTHFVDRARTAPKLPVFAAADGPAP